MSLDNGNLVVTDPDLLGSIQKTKAGEAVPSNLFLRLARRFSDLVREGQKLVFLQREFPAKFSGPILGFVHPLHLGLQNCHNPVDGRFIETDPFKAFTMARLLFAMAAMCFFWVASEMFFFPREALRFTFSL